MSLICEWGLPGLRAAARDRVVIIVDVLSFSTVAQRIAAGERWEDGSIRFATSGETRLN